MRKLRVVCVGVLLIGILVGVNRLCFATFDSTVGYQLAEKTAQKEITKDFPDMDLSKATIDVGCSVREYYFFRFRGDIQVYYTHNSGHIEKWVTRFLDTLTNQIPVNGQIPK